MFGRIQYDTGIIKVFRTSTELAALTTKDVIAAMAADGSGFFAVA